MTEREPRSDEREARMGWRSEDVLRYYHPVTGEEISRDKWRRIVKRRATRPEPA